MPNLTDEQKKKRGRILQHLAEEYHKKHRYLKRDQAFIEFGESLENDPVKLRIINALAALPVQETTFGERYKSFLGAAKGLPSDLASQHEHYRLKTKRRENESSPT